MDFATAVDYEREYPLPIRGPKGQKTEVTVWVYHTDSPIVQKRRDDARAANILKVDEETSAMDAGRMDIAFRIARWEWGGDTYNGDEPEYSQEKAFEIVSALPWFAEQVLDASAKLGNFTNG